MTTAPRYGCRKCVDGTRRCDHAHGFGERMGTRGKIKEIDQLARDDDQADRQTDAEPRKLPTRV
jgi:hypothetical protein